MGFAVKPANLAQYAELAKKQSDSVTWDYIAAGSEDESTIAYNRIAFSRWVLKPRVLTGCKNIDLSVSLFGRTLPSPILLAPIGYQKFVHADGELATIRAASTTKNLMVVSTMSNYSLEDIANQASESHWFQLYCMKDRELTLSLVRRAENAGYSAIVITVDTPRLGRRERDLSMGSALMNQLSPGNLPPHITSTLNSLPFSTIVDKLFDSVLDWDTIAWLKNQTKLPVLLKGLLCTADAEQAASLGIDGIIVSNHGGRQLDASPASLDVLSDIVNALKGKCKILLDGGVRRGTDILKARALGADAILIGRPILWGLICNGEKGVEHLLTLLKDELENAMLLCGQSSWEKVDNSLIGVNHSEPCCACRSSLNDADIL